MQGDCRPLYASRLNRDLSHLLSHDFNCSSATMKVSTIGDSLQKRNGGGILIEISIHEGPYRRGYFPFCIDIPENYPFKSVAVWSLEPIWHPNIDFLSGKVALPMEWSPVLTLNSLAIAVQMILLEPSTENPLNLEAYSHYSSNMKIFDELAQRFVSSSSASRFSREFGRNNHTGTRGGQTSSSHRSTTVVHGRTQDYNCMVSGDAMFVSTNSTPLNNKRKRYTDDMDEGGDDLDVHIASKAKMMSLDRQVSDDSVGSYINGLNVLDFHNSSTWPNENISQSINSSASSKR